MADIIVDINIEYFLFDAKKWLEVTPNLERIYIISGYSNIIPKLRINDDKKPRVSLTLGSAVIESEEYSFMRTLNVMGATYL